MESREISQNGTQFIKGNILMVQLTFDVIFGVRFCATFGGCEIGCETWVTSMFPLPVTNTFFFSLVMTFVVIGPGE